MPAPGPRLDRLAEAIDGREGTACRARRSRSTARTTAPTARRCLPAAMQQPRPRVFVGGKGDRLLRLVAERADGWNTCWTWTPDAYRERVEVLGPRVRARSAAIRRRCGARSGSTRCAARTSAISRGASSAWPPSAPPGVLARRRPRGVPRRAARRHRRRRCASRSRSGRRSASTRSSPVSARCRSTSRAATTSRCSGTRSAALSRRQRRAQTESMLGEIAAPAQDAAPFALGRAAPHAVLDAVQRARTRGTRRAPGTPRTRVAQSRHRFRRTGRTRRG